MRLGTVREGTTWCDPHTLHATRDVGDGRAWKACAWAYTHAVANMALCSRLSRRCPGRLSAARGNTPMPTPLSLHGSPSYPISPFPHRPASKDAQCIAQSRLGLDSAHTQYDEAQTLECISSHPFTGAPLIPRLPCVPQSVKFRDQERANTAAAGYVGRPTPPIPQLGTLLMHSARCSCVPLLQVHFVLSALLLHAALWPSSSHS